MAAQTLARRKSEADELTTTNASPFSNQPRAAVYSAGFPTFAAIIR
jgi:hypothetical protein